jgi:hypothetical protein
MKVDARTDIWSVGVRLSEMVTGVMPFGGPTSSHTLVQIIEQEPPPLAKDAPVELQRIIRKAMAKSPDERYQSAKDMAVDLKNLRKQLDHGQVLATDDTDDTDKAREKRRVVVVALVAMAVATAAIFAVSIWRASRERPVVVPTPAPVVAVPERRLTYWITVQKFR